MRFRGIVDYRIILDRRLERFFNSLLETLDEAYTTKSKKRKIKQASEMIEHFLNTVSFRIDKDSVRIDKDSDVE